MIFHQVRAHRLLDVVDAAHGALTREADAQQRATIAVSSLLVFSRALSKSAFVSAGSTCFHTLRFLTTSRVSVM